MKQGGTTAVTAVFGYGSKLHMFLLGLPRESPARSQQLNELAEINKLWGSN